MCTRGFDLTMLWYADVSCRQVKSESSKFEQQKEEWIDVEGEAEVDVDMMKELRCEFVFWLLICRVLRTLWLAFPMGGYGWRFKFWCCEAPTRSCYFFSFLFFITCISRGSCLFVLLSVPRASAFSCRRKLFFNFMVELSPVNIAHMTATLLVIVRPAIHTVGLNRT